MLSADRMEEFQSEEEEPWYDQQDLEQGKERQGLGRVLAESSRQTCRGEDHDPAEEAEQILLLKVGGKILPHLM